MNTDNPADFSEFARLMEEAAEMSEPADRLETIDPPGLAGLSELSTAPTLEPSPEAFTRRLEHLPKELGVLLTSVGVLGVVLPGIAGAPALIAGGLVLWPKTFGKVETWFENRFPTAHRQSMQQVGRFIDDLDRRYPQDGTP